MDDGTDNKATEPAADIDFRGYLDHADWQVIRGWAMNPVQPDTALWLEAVVDDGPPVAFLANLQRQDLVDAGVGHGGRRAAAPPRRVLPGRVPQVLPPATTAADVGAVLRGCGIVGHPPG